MFHYPGIFNIIYYKLRQIKKSICNRFYNWRTYRKLLQNIKTIPGYKIEKIKVNSMYKKIEIIIKVR